MPWRGSQLVRLESSVVSRGCVGGRRRRLATGARWRAASFAGLRPGCLGRGSLYLASVRKGRGGERCRAFEARLAIAIGLILVAVPGGPRWPTASEERVRGLVGRLSRGSRLRTPGLTRLTRDEPCSRRRRDGMIPDIEKSSIEVAAGYRLPRRIHCRNASLWMVKESSSRWLGTGIGAGGYLSGVVMPASACPIQHGRQRGALSRPKQHALTAAEPARMVCHARERAIFRAGTFPLRRTGASVAMQGDAEAVRERLALAARQFSEAALLRAVRSREPSGWR